MTKAFNRLTNEAAGIGDPSKLGGAIGEVLITTFIGMVVALIGAVLILIAVMSSRYRGQWLFWLMVSLGALYLLAFPLGTLIGIAFLVSALTRPHEFLRGLAVPPAS